MIRKPINMKYFLLGLFLTVAFNIFGQQTEKIKKIVEYEGRTYYPKHKEIYDVLKSDTEIKHGSYVFKAGSKKLIEGWYNNNLKDSLWIYYASGSHFHYIRSKGHYYNNKKAGIWKYFNKDGLEQTYNYSTDSLLFSVKAINDTILPVKIGNIFKERHVDSPPIFIEGESALYNYIDSNNYFYGYNLPKDQWITVTVQFVIDSIGNASDFKIKEGKYYDYNQNALNLIEKIPDYWIPAKINNKPVTSLWTITLKKMYSY